MDFSNSNATKRLRIDRSFDLVRKPKVEIPSLLDLALLVLSKNLETCNALYKLPISLVNRLLKFCETERYLQVCSFKKTKTIPFKI